MSLQQTEVVVVGAGGMGALFGAILQQGGMEVVLVDPNEAHVAAIQTSGLHLEGFGGERTMPMTATTNPEDVQAARLLLFQCKGHATRAAAKSIRHLVRGGAVCISFQNGLGNEEAIAHEVGSEHVLGGLTAMAGMLLGPGRVRDFSRVPSYLGELSGGCSERADAIARELTAAGLETHASPNIRQEIWKKLLGNISMSALSGLTDLTAAELMALPELKAISLAAMDEALSVGQAVGMELDRDAVLRGMELISQPGGTGDNKSSLCVDLLNRRRTEVDFIYGSVIELAESQGLATPTLKTLHALVKGVESRLGV